MGFQWLAGSNFSAHQPVNLVSNVVRNGATGVMVDSQGSANLSFNRIVGNSVAGVNNASTGAVNAENNWWGCNFGPGASGAGCPVAANGILGTVDADPWLTLTTGAVPNSVPMGGNSAVTSLLTINSALADTSGSGNVPNGTPATFGATGGTVAPPASTTTNGVTGTTFTANAYGLHSASTTVDGQTVSTAITVVPVCSTVSIPTNIQTLTNQQVVVPLNIDDTTSRNILSFTYTLNYDPAVLQYIGIDQAGTLSSAYSFSVNSTTPGTLIINGYGTLPLTGAGVLMNLRFQAIGAIGTSSAMSFAGMLLNEGVPCANTQNGLVTVISSTISGVVSYGNAGGFVPVPHTTLNAAGSVPQSTTSAVVTGAYTLSGLGAGAYTVTPSKTGDVNGISGLDAALISQHVVGLITLNANQLAAADVSNNGTVSGLDAAYISQWVVNIVNPSITGTWRFIPTSRNYANVNTAQVNQDYVGILMGEVTGNWVAPLVRPEAIIREIDEKKAIRVEAPVLRADPGTEVEIPLSIRDLSGKGVAAYQFDIEYDPEVLEPRKAAATLAGTISEGMMVTSNSPEPGLLKVVVYGVHPIEGGGPLVNLKFTAIGTVGSRSPLTVKGFMLNEGEIDVLVKDGEVAIEESEGASISGRLLLPNGVLAGKLRVTVRDSRGEMRAVVSDDNGEFTFGGLELGETYVVAVDSKRSGFAPQSVSLVERKVRIDMIARQ